MIRVLGTVFAALMGLAFGSFLNVCLSRWPEGESVVKPRSHCRNCGHTLAWWENLPLLSWLALRGRCRGCSAWIGWRYVMVEVAVGALWAGCFIQFTQSLPASVHPLSPPGAAIRIVGFAIFYWIVVALLVLDVEHLWLPDALTIPGIILGIVVTLLASIYTNADLWRRLVDILIGCAMSIFVSAGLVLLIRWIYWLIRRREGIGLGDAKLMALLAAWLGLQGALLAFGLGVVLGAVVAVMVLVLCKNQNSESRALLKLPLGTFLCIGGIISALWGQSIIAAYLRWARF